MTARVRLGSAVALLVLGLALAYLGSAASVPARSQIDEASIFRRVCLGGLVKESLNELKQLCVGGEVALSERRDAVVLSGNIRPDEILIDVDRLDLGTTQFVRSALLEPKDGFLSQGAEVRGLQIMFVGGSYRIVFQLPARDDAVVVDRAGRVVAFAPVGFEATLARAANPEQRP